MSLEKIDALLKKLSEDGTSSAGPHDALSSDPDYESVTPREQNFLHNFLGSASGNPTADRMNFHNDVRSYEYKNPDTLMKLFAKHYPAFSSRKGESRASAAHGSVEKIDALLKQLQKTEAVSSSGVNWEHFDSRIGSAIEKLTAARDVEHSKDTEYSAPLDMMMKIGSAIDDLADTVYILRDHKRFDGGYSSALRRAGDAIASAGQAAVSLATEISDNPRGIAGQSEEKSGVKSSYKGHEIKVIPHERGLKNVLYIDGKEQEAGFFSVGAAQKHGEKLIDDPEK